MDGTSSSRLAEVYAWENMILCTHFLNSARSLAAAQFTVPFQVELTPRRC